MKTFAFALAALSLASCTVPSPPNTASEAPAVGEDWSDVISPEDAIRLGNRRVIWDRALAATRAAAPDLVAAEGALLVPGAGALAVPPSGTYVCRTIKLGVEGLGGIAYQPFRCIVFDEGGARWLVKETGSQRQSGRIWPDGTFLGGLALGEEEGRIAYGSLRDRDVVGVVERLDDGRYRLVQPQPRYESQLDILELVPLRS